MPGLRRSRFSSVRRCLYLLCLLAGCRSGSFPQYAPDYREYAYIANSGGSTVSVLDLVHMRPQTVLAVAPSPVALAVSRTRNEVYALSRGLPGTKGSVAVIDAATNRVVKTIPAGKTPSALAVDAPDDRLYVANAGSNSVSIIDLRARTVVGVIGTGEVPGAVAISADNTTLAVANTQAGSVTLYEIGGKPLPRMRASFAGCPGARSLALQPDSSKLFVACSAGRQIMAVGLRASPAARAHRLPADERDRLLALLDVGAEPTELIPKPDGGEVFVANRASDTISEIETATNEVGGANFIGSRPQGGVVSADNALLWVANSAADTVGVYAIDDGKLVNTIHTGAGPGPVAFSADGHLLLAADTRSGDVSVLRTFERNFHREPVYGTLFTLLPAGSSPASIAVKAFREEP